MVKKLLIVAGLPASGKSSYALEWVNEDPEHRVRFNWDDLRFMMGGKKNYWIPSRESSGILKTIKESFIDKMMSKGWNIVVDNMNLNPKELDYYKKVVEEFNSKSSEITYEIEYKLFNTPVDECIKRDSFRERPIGATVIKNLWKTYKDFITKPDIENYFKSFNNIKKNLPHCIVVDLDGTIALNISNRPYFGEEALDLMKEDKVITPISNIIKSYPHKVIFLTGRDKIAEKVTKEWINKNLQLQKDYDLYTRKEGDYSSGSEYKMNIINTNILPNYNIDFVLEDSVKVVKTLRDNGIFVLQPFNSYY